MIEVYWHPAALRELRGAKAWYRKRNESAGERFSEEVIASVLRIRKRPRGRPQFEPGVYKCQVRRFPYALIYRLSERGIEVLVVCHHRRKPRYWKRRA